MEEFVMRFILLIVILASTHAWSNAMFSEFKLIFDFDKEKYEVEMPTIFGPRGVLVYLSEKKNNTTTYQLLAGGFAKSEKHFKKVYNDLKKQHQIMIGGKALNESDNMASGFLRKTFVSSSKLTNDAFQLIYDQKNFQYYILQGTQIVDKTSGKAKQSVKQKEFLKQFRSLASKVQSIDIGAGK
jgi:hypothetical protein